MTWNVEVRRYEDDADVKVLGPYGRERNAERVDDGMNINLNHAEFYTVIVPATRPTTPGTGEGE